MLKGKAKREYDSKYAHERRLLYPELIRAQEKSYRLKAKIEALTYYGNGKLACMQCGESRLACLSLDHINGNGAAERRKDSRQIGANLYKYLRKMGYPKGYQTLCMNCQYVKRYMNNELGGGNHNQ